MAETDGRIFVEAIYGDAFVEVRKITSRTQIDEHAMIVSGGVQFQIRPRVIEQTLPVSNRGIVGINRPPRDMQPPTEKTINIEAPPRPGPKSRISPIMIAVPMIMGISMAVLLKNPMFLGMALFSPAMMVGSAMENKRNGKNEFKVLEFTLTGAIVVVVFTRL